MQFKNVMCHCQQDGFCLYVDMPFCQEATVVPVCLDVSKSALCLDAAVDTQLNAMFARDTRQVFLPFLLENLGHLEMFRALIKRLLAVVAMDAVRLARAVLAAGHGEFRYGDSLYYRLPFRLPGLCIAGDSGRADVC